MHLLPSADQVRSHRCCRGHSHATHHENNDAHGLQGAQTATIGARHVEGQRYAGALLGDLLVQGLRPRLPRADFPQELHLGVLLIDATTLPHDRRKGMAQSGTCFQRGHGHPGTREERGLLPELHGDVSRTTIRRHDLGGAHHPCGDHQYVVAAVEEVASPEQRCGANPHHGAPEATAEVPIHIQRQDVKIRHKDDEGCHKMRDFEDRIVAHAEVVNAEGEHDGDGRKEGIGCCHLMFWQHVRAKGDHVKDAMTNHIDAGHTAHNVVSFQGLLVGDLIQGPPE
mmetsp:Transcript_2923/g.6813  ORF Transcript_2923/g.6813 Transcript_2923/m.6813 type:complete len:283 (+) Transcript_2923:370-1218(+)